MVSADLTYSLVQLLYLSTRPSLPSMFTRLCVIFRGPAKLTQCCDSWFPHSFSTDLSQSNNNHYALRTELHLTDKTATQSHSCQIKALMDFKISHNNIQRPSTVKCSAVTYCTSKYYFYVPHCSIDFRFAKNLSLFPWLVSIVRWISAQWGVARSILVSSTYTSHYWGAQCDETRTMWI